MSGIRNDKHSKCMESNNAPVFKKGDNTDCSSYRGISLLPATYRFISSLFLLVLIPYMEEIIGDRQCRFRRNRSTNNQIFCSHLILDKKWE
jgi:hypothetical protein